MGGSQSNLCKSINLLCDRYRLETHTLSKYPFGYLVNRINKSVNIDSCFVARGVAVKEFIHMRHQQPHTEDAQEIIDFICTV